MFIYTLLLLSLCGVGWGGGVNRTNSKLKRKYRLMSLRHADKLLLDRGSVYGGGCIANQ